MSFNTIQPSSGLFAVGETYTAIVGAPQTGKSNSGFDYPYVEATVDPDGVNWTARLFAEEINTLAYFQVQPGSDVTLLCVGMRNNYPVFRVVGLVTEAS